MERYHAAVALVAVAALLAAPATVASHDDGRTYRFDGEGGMSAQPARPGVVVERAGTAFVAVAAPLASSRRVLIEDAFVVELAQREPLVRGATYVTRVEVLARGPDGARIALASGAWTYAHASDARTAEGALAPALADADGAADTAWPDAAAFPEEHCGNARAACDQGHADYGWSTARACRPGSPSASNPLNLVHVAFGAADGAQAGTTGRRLCAWHASDDANATLAAAGPVPERPPLPRGEPPGPAPPPEGWTRFVLDATPAESIERDATSFVLPAGHMLGVEVRADAGTALGAPVATFVVGGAARSGLRLARGGDEGTPERLGLEDFEGDAAGWRRTGLWRVGGGCFDGHGSAASLQYNDAATCTYDVKDASGAPQRNGGNATRAVTLPPGRAWATLSLWQHRDVEATGSYDRMSLHAGCDGAERTLGRWDANTPRLTDWEALAYDLSWCAGHTLTLRAEFDTRDAWRNAQRGWALDDVAIDLRRT